MRRGKKVDKSADATAYSGGIISDGRELGSSVSLSTKDSQKSSGAVLGNLDRRGEGFHPIRQNTQGVGGVIANTETDDLADPSNLSDESSSRDRARNNEKHHSSTRPSSLRRIPKLLGRIVFLLALIAAVYIGYKVYLSV